MADVTSVPGVGGISGDSPRQGGFASRQRPKPGASVPRPGETVAAGAVPGAEPAQSEADPTAALISALDRLRATDDVRLVEAELMRAMRGARHYQDESRHNLPVIDDPERPPPPPPPAALPPGQVG